MDSRFDTLFLHARELASAEERSAFLDKVCAGDPELRRRLEAKLIVEAEAAEFFGEADAENIGQELTVVGHAEPANATQEGTGERIGRYKLLQQIGEGGFGTVWMAEQMEPVSRRVALKIIKLGMDTREVIARFEAERQALAMMEHPNIAKVLDAGATQSGRPYFVMELVKGMPITKYCDEAGLGTRERLALFGDVCSAINHAHQKGVIHRDIKPSNVMVTQHGDKPVVKVIDFGIAKATQGKLTDKTLFTRFEQFIGTPVYMSPEQASTSGLDIDTRSDIYALGVLLYELLTGKPPFDAKSLLSAGYEEMRRIIREVEPLKPSAKLNTAAGDERTTLAKARHISPEKLNGMVEPDLDWIVMKAIEKDRARRYETANGLALDIQRFLSDEPVSAGPPDMVYRLQKFAKRNKVALRVAAVITVLLIVATVLSTSPANFALTFGAISAVLVGATVLSTRQAVRATKAERRAEKTATDEKLAREDAEAVSKFLIDVFQSADPARDGPAVTVAETLNHAARHLELDLVIQTERRAKLHDALGRTYYGLGLFDHSIEQREKAVTHFLRSAGPYHRDTLNAQRDLGFSQYEINEVAARRTLEDVLQLYLKHLGPTDSDTLWARTYLAMIYDRDEARRKEALTMREDILRLRRELSGSEHRATIYAMNELAISCFFAGNRRQEAVKLQREVIALGRRILGPKHPDTLYSVECLADYLPGIGQLDEAIKILEDLIPLNRAIIGPTHPLSSSAVCNLAGCYINAGRWDNALGLLCEWAALTPRNSYLTIRWCVLQAWLGKVAGHFESCRQVLGNAIGTDKPSTASRAAAGYCVVPSPDPQLLQTALMLARRAVDIGGQDGRLRWYLLTLGMAEYRHGDYRASHAALLAAINALESPEVASWNPGSSRVFIGVTARLFCAMGLWRQHQETEARDLFATAEAQMRPMPAPGQAPGQIVPYDDAHNDVTCWLAYKEAKALIFPEQ